MDTHISHSPSPNHNHHPKQNKPSHQQPEKAVANNTPRNQEDAVEQSSLRYEQNNLDSKYEQPGVADHGSLEKMFKSRQKILDNVKQALQDRIFAQTPCEYSPELVWGNQDYVWGSVSKMRDQQVQAGDGNLGQPKLQNKLAYQQVIVIVNNHKNNNIVSLSTSEPLPTQTVTNYFQVTIRKPPRSSKQPDLYISHQFGQSYIPAEQIPNSLEQQYLASFGIGVIEGGINEMTNSGFKVGNAYNSVGIRDCEIFGSGIKLTKLDWKLAIGDTIGMGVNYMRKSVFFTHNSSVYQLKAQFNKLMFPIVTVSEPGNYEFSIRFANRRTHSDLCFKAYTERAKQRQQKFKDLIWEKPQLETPQLHRLVQEYLQFHGYSQTAFQLEAQIKKSGIGRNRSARSLQSEQYSSIIAAEIEETINAYVPSDFEEVGDGEQEQQKIKKLRRKGTDEAMPRREDNKKSRKINKVRKQKHREIEKQIRDKYHDLHENQRIRVVKNIRDGEIECALRVFEAAFSGLARRYKFISVFLKVHIFIKKSIQEGLSVALAYFRENLDQFQEYHHNLFPYYSSPSHDNTIVYKPLREVLYLVCEDKRHEFQFQKQLQAFSEFISQFLCRKCGFLERSPLEYAVTHYHEVKSRCQQLKIPLAFMASEL